VNVADDYPPNIKQIAAVFPECRRRGVIFTYGDTIYAPHGVKVPAALVAHEKAHSERQAEIGAEVWWIRYLADTAFRFEEELLAHRAEYQWYVRRRPHKRALMLKHIAARLSSPLYGCIVPYQQAVDMILEPG